MPGQTPPWLHGCVGLRVEEARKLFKIENVKGCFRKYDKQRGIRSYHSILFFCSSLSMIKRPFESHDEQLTLQVNSDPLTFQIGYGIQASKALEMKSQVHNGCQNRKKCVCVCVLCVSSIN